MCVCVCGGGGGGGEGGMGDGGGVVGNINIAEDRQYYIGISYSKYEMNRT